MKIDNINDVEKSLNDIKYFFSCIDDEKKRVEIEIKNKELERDDLLHEIELAALNAIERGRTYSRLQKTLQERRILKDKLELVNTLKGFSSKFINKGICNECQQAITNVNTLKKNWSTRQYTPRILNNLKCAKNARMDK